MPFTWAQIGMPGAGPGGIAFYGPYVVVDGPEGNLSMDATPHVECTPTHDRPIPRPTLSELTPLSSSNPLGHQAGLSGERVKPRYEARAAIERTRRVVAPPIHGHKSRSRYAGRVATPGRSGTDLANLRALAASVPAGVPGIVLPRNFRKIPTINLLNR